MPGGSLGRGSFGFLFFVHHIVCTGCSLANSGYGIWYKSTNSSTRQRGTEVSVGTEPESTEEASRGSGQGARYRGGL